MGDHIRVLPSGNGSRPDCGIWLVTNTSCCSDEVTSSPQRQISLAQQAGVTLIPDLPLSHDNKLSTLRTLRDDDACGRSGFIKQGDNALRGGAGGG
jgi:hypothetical protein